MTTSNKPDNIKNNMDKTDKKERWSKKQIIGLIADSISQNGKLRELITRILKSKKEDKSSGSN